MAVVLSLAPLVLLEISLRSFAPAVAEAVDFDPVVDLEQLRPLFMLNESAGRWEIPPKRFNFFQPDSFRADKPPGSRRIFVLGGSTVQGRPYSIETSFSTWLKLRLQAAAPETSFEVVNCGGVSYASYRVAKILDEVLDHQPDAIVFYTGHNEFLEDREYADVRDLSGPMRGIARAASNIRTITWIQGRLREAPLTRRAMSEEVDARLDHAGGLERYQRDPTWRSGVETHFAGTLRRMVNTTQQANVPLVLCTPASDLVNTPPFKVESAADLTPEQASAFRVAWRIAQDESVDPVKRLDACRECLAIDAEHAGASYIAGRLHLQRGQTARALPYLTAARDFDVCPLRATTPIIEAVIDIAEEHQVPLIRTAALLDQRDANRKRIPDSIVDPEFFVDHLHPTVAGHQEIGAAIALIIDQLGWFSGRTDTEQAYQSLVVKHLSSLGEDYYARGRQRLEGLRRWAAGRAGELVPPTSKANGLD